MVRMKRDGIENYLISADEVSLAYLIEMLSENAKSIGLVAFMKPTAYYESLVGFLMGQSLDEKRKRFINSR